MPLWKNSSVSVGKFLIRNCPISTPWLKNNVPFVWKNVKKLVRKKDAKNGFGNKRRKDNVNVTKNSNVNVKKKKGWSVKEPKRNAKNMRSVKHNLKSLKLR